MRSSKMLHIAWTAETTELGLVFDVNFSVIAGQVVANVTITKGNVDVNTLKNLLDFEIRYVVDLIGYLHGIRYDVDIISTTSLDTGDRCIFGIGIPILVERRKAGRTGSISANMLITVGKEIPAEMILADFRRAMGHAVNTGFYCYRAIETMMQSMKVKDNENHATAWSRLRECLRVDRAAIDSVKMHSDSPRHGRPSAISDEERANVFRITDELIKRFLEYLIRGKKTLPEDEFPLFKS